MTRTYHEAVVEPDDQWDALTVIQNLEELEKTILGIAEHSAAMLGTPLGRMPDGTHIIDHPISGCITVIREILNHCYAEYGRNLRDNPPHDGTAISDEGPKPQDQ